MPTLDLATDQTRTFQGRAAADTARREISGIGVPLEVETVIWPGFREVFDQDCVFEGIERAKLKQHHRELIGVVVNHTREAGNLSIVTRASEIPAGDIALTLAADGALDSFSIGFRPVEHVRTDHEDGSFTIRHTRVLTNEFSLTDNPAYTGATVTDVRESTTTQGEPAMTITAPAAAFTREELDTALDQRFDAQERALDARLATIMQGAGAPQAHRTAGAMLLALAEGDEAAVREYNDTVSAMYEAAAEGREYTGGTTADSPIKDGWVGDLTRIFDASSGVLSEFFATGALPDRGMNIEYAQLKSNTVKVDEQKQEGDDLALGKVELENKTAPVKTYGGYVELSRQQILRSTLPILDRSLEALTMAAGARKKAAFRAEYAALLLKLLAIADDKGVLPIGKTLADSTAGDWTDLVVDAAVRFSQVSLPLDGMIASVPVFKHLNRLEINGKRVFRLAEPNGMIGTLDLTGLNGDLAGVTVICDPDRAGAQAEFANNRALRAYDSPLVQLQDENIVNLSKQYSAYRFGAVAAEIPSGVAPVKFEA